MDVIQRADVVTLERELRELWKQMASKSQPEGDQAVTRACVHNLVVYAPGERSETELSRLLSDLMVEQPGRVILMLPNPKSAKNDLTAWVNAQCHRTSGQRQQVCSEQIVIRATGGEVRSLPSLVLPLLVPDLPVFFWWRHDLSAEWDYFQEVVEQADRVIIDSSRFSQPVESLRRIFSIASAQRDSTSFTDLAWSRLTPWRQMIAGFFDHAFCSGTLSSIAGLDLQANTSTGFSAEALMLVAWLASRLQWTPQSKQNNVLLMNAAGRQVQIRILVRPPVPNGIRGIAAVTLRADAPAVTFHMALDAETKYLRGTVEMEGARPAASSSRLRASEDEFLGGELEILGPDRIYETTINILERII